jgi:hypothetical protein
MHTGIMSSTVVSSNSFMAAATGPQVSSEAGRYTTIIPL